MSFQDFHYNTLEEIIKDAEVQGIKLNFSSNFAIFAKKIEVNGITIPNSLAVHPMEGCDGTADGRPDELTKRRYARFARGGAGLIWFEAVAAVPEGRANPRQLWIHNDNLSDFQNLSEDISKNAAEEFGKGYRPVRIMQLTHSGRFSRPQGKPAPIIAYHNPYLDMAMKVAEDTPVITDSELEQLEEKFEAAAILAQKSGFDGVDIKCCHRYLNSELLAGFTRKGRYGETFEGRTRFLLNIVDRIRSRLGKSFIVTTRMNIYDGIPYPFGWGTDHADYRRYDPDEPKKLAAILHDKGVDIVNFTMGTPYYNPHVNRPYDKGGYVPDEHPLTGVARLVNGIGEVQQAVPGMVVVGTGFSWMRQFAPYLAAGTLEKGLAGMIGFGREAFAYPDFAKDILFRSAMEKGKCCIACGKCTEIMRAGGTPGCAIRDAGVYAPIYRKYCLK
ncbi:MAG: flavin oxidoreductase/NADH oxidase [Clostridiaceae bacterium]